MLGKLSGVSTQILQLQPKALVTHCQGHSLNLGIKFTLSNSKLMADVMGTVTEIITLVKYSPKRERMLGDIKENLYYDKQDTEVVDDLEITMAPKLNRLSATRWAVRGNAYKKILLNYDELAIL